MVKEKQNLTDGIENFPSEKSPTNEKAVEKPANAVDKKRLDPTRYGDWEKNGRCIDF